MTPARSAVNMAAVQAVHPSRKSGKITPVSSGRATPRNGVPVAGARVRNILVTTLLILIASSAGVAIGAIAISPAISSGALSRALSAVLAFLQRKEGRQIVSAVILVAVIIVLAPAIRQLMPRRRAAAARSPITSMRTPRDVEVLAAAGTAPADIARRTRLPVDAISMLLVLGQTRQVQPPTA